MDNVNNLNGVPNFGHGLPEEVKAEAPETVEVENLSEEVAAEEDNGEN